jgi:thiamine biosynthesis lipoprotein
MVGVSRVALAGGLLSACREAPAVPQAPSISGSTMGTYYRVTLASIPSELTEDDLKKTVKSRLDGINALMSTYKPDSEVSQFNRSRDTSWFPVSAETATVVSAALQVFTESDGAFDITVGPLVDLWGFGPAEQSDQLPEPTEIEALVKTTGSRHLHVRLDPPALKKDHEALRIDLSGIAKGYAVDAIADTLDELGLSSYLVDIGGEMRARGHKRDGSPWKIAIESPTAGQRGIQTTLPLRDGAIATSGDYRNYFERDGRRYSHEIDPRTGHPIGHQLVSVSVLDGSCMRADAWATALIILGPKQGKTLAEKAGLPSLLIVKDGDSFREVRTTGSAPFPDPF